MVFRQGGLNLIEHLWQSHNRIAFDWQIDETHSPLSIYYRVRLKETLARISIRTMKISRNAMSPLTAVKSAPLNRICLIALTE